MVPGVTPGSTNSPPLRRKNLGLPGSEPARSPTRAGEMGFRRAPDRYAGGLGPLAKSLRVLAFGRVSPAEDFFLKGSLAESSDADTAGAGFAPQSPTMVDSLWGESDRSLAAHPGISPQSPFGLRAHVRSGGLSLDYSSF